MKTNKNISIMGIVNLTDNSYFAASRCLDDNGNPDEKRIVGKIKKYVEEGADIIDLGGCSTKPGSEAVSAEEEWERIYPALKIMVEMFPNVAISIDTYRESVVRRAYDTVGDFIVNDISSGEDDPDMLDTVGKLSLKYIAMHKRGNPKTMQNLTDYGREPEEGPSAVTREVLRYFENFSQKAEKYGINSWILDPGFGFAKTVNQNYQMLKELKLFTKINRDILVGISRKSMIFKLFGITPEESLPATSAIHMAALQNGATVLRVHDAAEAKQVVDIYNKIK